ncbi:MAG: alkaline phosphatase family protein, partial [Planctomycetales bacterium]|nr:alkaline phosphatase family protein [Planctomycetales bacterium]
LIWTEAACHLIGKRKPNLLLVHLLNVDSTHHTVGPQSPAGYTANAYADTCVAKILAAIEEACIRSTTTVFIVADHGFVLTPMALRPNVLLRNEKMLTADEIGKVTEARVHVISEGGIGLVYCTDPGTAAADRTQVTKLMTGQKGISAILEPSQFAEYGLPHPREYSQAPDLILVAKDGYGFSNYADGEEFVTINTEGQISLGSHGFISTLAKMNAPCILWGQGIRPGVHLKQAENIDVAATTAELLGLKDFPGDGKVLKEALDRK